MVPYVASAVVRTLSASLAFVVCARSIAGAGELDPRRAPAWEQECDAGNWEACGNLGALYEGGRGLPRNADKARTYHKKACIGGYWFSCNNLILLGDDTGRREQADRARAGCHDGSAWACDQLALFTTDKDEQMDAFERACAGGVGPSCYSLSLKVLARDAQGAAALRRKACALGQPDACREEQHDAKAASDRVRLGGACAHGDAEACERQAGLCDAKGLPLLPDAERRRLLQRACKARAQSCFPLAKLEGDEKKRVPLWKRACQAGVLEACSDLALFYEYDDPPRPNEVVRLYGRACDGGESHGCWMLATMLADGHLVAVDKPRAIDLYRKVCARGSADGCAPLVLRLGKLTDTADALAGLTKMRELCRADFSDCFALDAATRGARENAALVGALKDACTRGTKDACDVLAIFEHPRP